MSSHVILKTNSHHMNSIYKNQVLLTEAIYVITQLYPHLLIESDKREDFEMGENIIMAFYRPGDAYDAYKWKICNQYIAKGQNNPVSYEKYKKFLDYIFSQITRLMAIANKEEGALKLLIKQKQLEDISIGKNNTKEYPLLLTTSLSRHFYYVVRSYLNIVDLNEVLLVSGIKDETTVEADNIFLRKEIVDSMRKILNAYYNFNIKHKVIIRPTPLPPFVVNKRFGFYHKDKPSKHA